MFNPKIRTTLNLHPDLAEKVGLVIAEYAILEMLMLAIYAQMSPAPMLENFSRFYSLRSMHLRKELVLNAAQIKPLEESVIKALQRLWRRFAAAADRRTEIAHCAYVADKTTVMRLRLIGNQARYEATDETLFDRTFNQYHTLGTDLITFAGVIAVSVDHYRRVMQELPRPPGLVHPDLPPDSQDHLTQSEIDETRASLLRLGLPHLTRGH